MTILPLKYGDISLIKDLQPAGWYNIFPIIEYYTRSSFCFPIKITIDKKIVGIGTGIIHNDVAWLAHIIVHPDNRKQGLGKLITETLVESLHSKDIETIYLIATDLGAPVYEKAGFETETEYLFYKDIKADPGWLPSENIIPYTNELKTQIASLDKQVSGENRMNHVEEHLDGSYVFQRGNIVEGFYLPTFGEGLITSVTPSAGIELMKYRFGTKDSVVFPQDNLAAAKFMEDNKDASFKKAKRMRLGKERRWGPAHIYGRIGGNLG